MKAQLIDFFSSSQVIALLSTVSIFLVTILLVAKRWINFSIAFILLLFSLIVGILINNPQFFTNYDQLHSSIDLNQQNEFKKMLLQAFDEVKLELKKEQESVTQLKDQLKLLVQESEAQKQKLKELDHVKIQIQKGQTSVNQLKNQMQQALQTVTLQKEKLEKFMEEPSLLQSEQFKKNEIEKKEDEITNSSTSTDLSES